MRSLLKYSVVAISLGLAFILVPMLAFTGVVRQQYDQMKPFPMSTFLEAGDEHLQQPRISASEVEFCAACFAVALIAYVFVRSRIPKQQQNWIGPFLY